MPALEVDFGARPNKDGTGVLDEYAAAVAVAAPEGGEDAGFHITLGVLAARLGKHSPEPHWRKALKRYTGGTPH